MIPPFPPPKMLSFTFFIKTIVLDALVKRLMWSRTALEFSVLLLASILLKEHIFNIKKNLFK